MSISFGEGLYNFISEYIGRNGRSPSYSELTDAMKISPRSKSLITRNLKKLEKERKVILTKQGRNVAIQLTSNELPLLGKISAGEPIEALSNIEYINLDQLFLASDRFALKVKGTSMIDEGILDNDIIICRKVETAREGEIVVALIDRQNATLKRISYKVKNVITLIPANEDLNSRAYQADRITIQGVYVGLIRLNG